MSLSLRPMFRLLYYWKGKVNKRVEEKCIKISSKIKKCKVQPRIVLLLLLLLL